MTGQDRTGRLPLISLLVWRKKKRISDASEYKTNGPIGIRLDISNGGVYIKGTCIYANLDPYLMNDRYEIPPGYLINKPLSIKMDLTKELIHKLHYPYWKPHLLDNGDYLIKRPPIADIVSLYEGTYEFPKSQSSSELIFTVPPRALNAWDIQSLFSIPSWIDSIINNERDKLDRIYYGIGSTPSR